MLFNATSCINENQSFLSQISLINSRFFFIRCAALGPAYDLFTRMLPFRWAHKATPSECEKWCGRRGKRASRSISSDITGGRQLRIAMCQRCTINLCRPQDDLWCMSQVETNQPITSSDRHIIAISLPPLPLPPLHLFVLLFARRIQE